MAQHRPKFICIKEIAGLLNASISSAGRYAKDPAFPDPHYFGGKKMWSEDEVWEWIRSCRRPRNKAVS